MSTGEKQQRRARPRLTAAGGVALLALALSPLPDPPGEPWVLLDEARSRMAAAGPLAADFVQLYVPAGFSSGERESGRVAMDLPDCLRWDYEVPYAKSFLLCGGTVYTWNRGERSGRRYRLAPREEPGLDLLLLSVADLRPRYRAEISPGREEGGVSLALTPEEGSPGLREATLTLDRERGYLLALAYRDAQGNLTRFELSGYRPLVDETAFTPPATIEWEEG